WCRACGERFQFRCRHCRGLHRLDAEICGRTGHAIPNHWKEERQPGMYAFYGPVLDRLGRTPRKVAAVLVLFLIVSALCRPSTHAMETHTGAATTNPPK